MVREALREQLIILDKRVRDAARADRVYGRRSPTSSGSSFTGCGSTSRSSGSETQLRPGSFPRLVPEGAPGAGTIVRASRWTPWRWDAVLEMGCPAPHPT